MIYHFVLLDLFNVETLSETRLLQTMDGLLLLAAATTALATEEVAVVRRLLVTFHLSSKP